MSSPTMPSSPALTPTPIPFPALILAHGLLAGHPELLRLHAEHGGLTPPFDDAVLASCSNMVHTLTASRLPPAEEAVLLAWLAELSAHRSAHPTSIQVVAPPQLGNLRHQFLQRFRRSVSSLGGIRGRGTFGTVGVGVFAAGDTNTNTADVNAANANGTHTTTNANANTNTASPRHRPNLAIDTRAANTLLRRVHEVSQWSPYSTPTSPAGGSGSGAVEGNATPSPFGELESPAMTCGTTADNSSELVSAIADAVATQVAQPVLQELNGLRSEMRAGFDGLEARMDTITAKQDTEDLRLAEAAKRKAHLAALEKLVARSRVPATTKGSMPRTPYPGIEPSAVAVVPTAKLGTTARSRQVFVGRAARDLLAAVDTEAPNTPNTPNNPMADSHDATSHAPRAPPSCGVPSDAVDDLRGTSYRLEAEAIKAENRLRCRRNQPLLPVPVPGRDPNPEWTVSDWMVWVGTGVKSWDSGWDWGSDWKSSVGVECKEDGVFETGWEMVIQWEAVGTVEVGEGSMSGVGAWEWQDDLDWYEDGSAFGLWIQHQSSPRSRPNSTNNEAYGQRLSSIVAIHLLDDDNLAAWFEYYVGRAPLATEDTASQCVAVAAAIGVDA